MKPLHERTISKPLQPEPTQAPSQAVDQQSGQLVGYLDELFRRMMMQRRSDEGPAPPEVSREEIRAMILLGTNGRMIMSSLAESLGVPLSTATHTVDRLVAKGLAIRSRSDEDRRIVRVAMSDLGKQLQETHRAKQREMARSWLTPLSSGEREIFLELMDKITRLTQPEPESKSGR